MKDTYVVQYEFKRKLFAKNEVKSRKIVAQSECEAKSKCISYCMGRLYKWFSILSVAKLSLT